MLRRTVLLAVGLALALPSVAAAATLSFDPPVPCLEQGKRYPLAASGFTPEGGFQLALAGESDTQSFFVNSSGGFVGADEQEFSAREYPSLTPKTLNLTATDGTNPAITASLTIQEVEFGSNLPVKGKPNQVVTWQFAGFLNNAPIYAHYLYERKEKMTVRFGTGQGPCGTLTKRAVRFPIKKPKNFGTWEIKVDSNPKWSRNSEPLDETSFNVAKPKKKKRS